MEVHDEDFVVFKNTALHEAECLMILRLSKYVERAMGIRMICLAVFFCVAWSVSAAEREVCDEKQEVHVILNASEEIDEVSCAGFWNIAHVQTASGEPLLQAIAALVREQVYGTPFTSKMLDDAVQALVKDIERDDKDEDPDKLYAPLKTGVGCLSPQGGWIWCADDIAQCWRYPFVPGLVRLFVPKSRLLLNDVQGLSPFFEGFPAQSGCEKQTPAWWRCALSLGLAAVDREMIENKEVCVFISVGEEWCTEMCQARWNITHVKTEEGESLWHAIAGLEGECAIWMPFRSKVLDDAMRALVKDMEKDENKEEPYKQYASLKKGVECLSPHGGWYWFVEHFDRAFEQLFAPGTVRLALRHAPIGIRVPNYGKEKQLLFEGFPVQSKTGGLKPSWLKNAPYWWSDRMD